MHVRNVGCLEPMKNENGLAEERTFLVTVKGAQGMLTTIPVQAVSESHARHVVYVTFGMVDIISIVET